MNLHYIMKEENLCVTQLHSPVLQSYTELYGLRVPFCSQKPCMKLQNLLYILVVQI